MPHERGDAVQRPGRRGEARRIIIREEHAERDQRIPERRFAGAGAEADRGAAVDLRRLGIAGGDKRIVVAINPSNTDASCTLPSDYVKLLSGGLAQEISQEPAEKTVLLSIGNPARFDGTQLHVPARSATILPC